MKTEIKADGYIHIIAETVTEGFALEALFPVPSEICEKCNQIIDMNIVIDGSILNIEKKDEKESKR